MASQLSAQLQRVVLFDGVCNFCDSAVLFIIDRDSHERFRFAALQSPTAQRLLRAHGEHVQDEGGGERAREEKPAREQPGANLSSIVLIEGDRIYTRSSAALRIARLLDAPWPLFYWLILVPRPLRDWAYSAFAARRYRWFGELDACRVPTPELRARFLDM